MRYDRNKPKSKNTLKLKYAILAIKFLVKYFPNGCLKVLVKEANKIPGLQYNKITKADYRMKGDLYIVTVFETEKRTPMALHNAIVEINDKMDFLSDVFIFESKGLDGL
jgi:hypothetical protein